MKVAICYPPLDSKNGVPLLSQNRQFQWFKSPTFIYPVVPALAATLLYEAGHQVYWLDGIAENLSFNSWFRKLKKERPDLILIETKTPVIKKHWQIINRLKKIKKKNWDLKIVLVGDHVTALPKESFKYSQVDYVLTGGNYDFLFLNLVNHLTKGKKLQPGIYYRQKGKVKNTGKFKLNHNLNKLPFINRDLTKWENYAFKNGIYKYTPGTYIMAGRDCWHRINGGCTFCSWTTLYPTYNVRTPANVLKEVRKLVDKYDLKEIMDDTGTFPGGSFLKEFCQGMIKSGINKKINFNCNLRFGFLTKKDYTLMARAGFRLLLFGLESANQKTIDRLNKNIKVKNVEKELQLIQEVNKKEKGHLEPHLTFMIGYPWEDKKDALNTLNFARNLFKKGLLDTLQATVMIPYPGTKLFNLAKKQKWLTTTNWDDYDMKKPVLKTSLTDKEVLNTTQEIYKSFLTPKFIFKKLKSIKTLADIKFYARAAKQVIGHYLDFKK
ncbi:B12-binding domain-containing radical SAM protein [Patescibacteria group bacterium]